MLVARMNGYIDFSYTHAWRFYRELGDPTDDIIMKVYTFDPRAVKYNSDGVREPFLNRSMRARKIHNDDRLVMQNREHFQNGAYIVCAKADTPQDEERAMRQKMMFIVSPRAHNDVANGPFYTADHFSFLVNQGVKDGKKLQFHRTTYVPDYDDAKFGQVQHKKNHIPLAFLLPRDPEALIDNGFLQPAFHNLAHVVHGLLSRPYDRGLDQETSIGGGGRRHRREGRRAVRAFVDLWAELPIQKILVTAVKSGRLGLYDVTIMVFDRLRTSFGSAAQKGFFIRLPEATLRDEPKFQTTICACFNGLTWDDFKDVGDLTLALL